jgi:hypothetical protein
MTRAADRERLARQAMGKLSRDDSENEPKPAPEPGAGIPALSIGKIKEAKMIMAGFEMAIGAALAIGAGCLALFAIALGFALIHRLFFAFADSRVGQWLLGHM